MSGAGVHISALSRCRRLPWSSCGRPMSALSRAAPTRPSAGAPLLTAALALPSLSHAEETDLQLFTYRFIRRIRPASEDVLIGCVYKADR